MDIETATRTILEKNPAIKSQKLLEKVRGKTGKERSAIFEIWESMDNRHKLYREKGCYWLHKPEPQKSSFIKVLTDYRKWSKEFKVRQEIRKKREFDKETEKLDVETEKMLASIVADEDE